MPTLDLRGAVRDHFVFMDVNARLNHTRAVDNLEMEGISCLNQPALSAHMNSREHAWHMLSRAIRAQSLL